jgi:membrane protease YdiL (CAAX protease family)
MNTNKKKAGLLWAIIPIKYRKNIANFFTSEEIEALKQSFDEYKKLDGKTKLKIQKQIYRIFHFPYKILYLILFLFIILFIILFFYYISKFNFTPLFLFSLFWPYAMGIIGLIILLTFSPYELYFLFRFSYKIYHNFLSLFVLYIIIYLLYTINELEKIKINLYYPIEKWILFLGIISAPILEECIFRYYIPNMIGKSYFRQIVGHLISNVVFAILHLPNWEQGILYFLCGMFLSLLVITTQRLFYALIVHIISNIWIFYFYLG